MARVRLIGLSDGTNSELTRVLESHAHTVVASDARADAVFCSSERVSQLVDTPLPAPVIVVTAEAATAKWLDALDRGASDYCSEPIEAYEVLWALAAALRKLS